MRGWPTMTGHELHCLQADTPSGRPGVARYTARLAHARRRIRRRIAAGIRREAAEWRENQGWLWLLAWLSLLLLLALLVRIARVALLADMQ